MSFWAMTATLFSLWLWDHLRSNVDLYIESKESRPDEVAKKKPKETRREEVANQKPKESFLNLHNDSVPIKSDKFSKSRRSKDWKSTIRDPDEPPLLCSAMIANIHAHDKSYMRQSPSPQPVIERKRDRSAVGGHKYERGQPDERSQVKVCASSPQICDTEHLFLKLPLLEAKLASTLIKRPWKAHGVRMPLTPHIYAWLKEGLMHRFITRDL